jgi:hypothetical protein
MTVLILLGVTGALASRRLPACGKAAFACALAALTGYPVSFAFC